MGRSADWRFLVDENLDPRIVDELAERGLAAAYVLDVLFEGADDFDDILPYCRETNTVLVTNNVRDFNATDLETDDHAGIVVVHDKQRPAEEIAAEISRIAESYPSSDHLRGFESADDWTRTIPNRYARGGETAISRVPPAAPDSGAGSPAARRRS